MNEFLPPLTPIISNWMKNALADRAQIKTLFETYGSPLNLHHLVPFNHNYEAYASVLNKHNLRHLILFARKANKLPTFASEASRLGFGVDTASYRELEQCLQLGCAPEHLVLTAAIKTQRVVELAVANEVLIVVDNEDECVLINQVAESLGKKAQVGIRVSGFEVNGRVLYSRFGFPIKKARDLIITQIGKTFKHLKYIGLHFHLNGYSRQERGAALHATIQCADDLYQHRIRTHFIDIGGGLLINYLAHETQWHTFHQELRQAVQGNRPPITFNNNGLGYQLIDGKIHGEANVYPYYNETPKAQFLEEVLIYKGENGLTNAQMLRERDIQLRLEPGRSLLDQTGMTVAQVVFRKHDSRGDLLIGLDMNRSQLFSSSADFLLDPLIVYQNAPSPALPPAEGAEAGYFVGAFCLEQDVILKRKLPFKRIPQIGDWVAFVNTAGYMMHFYETQAHLFDLATNFVDTTYSETSPTFEQN